MTAKACLRGAGLALAAAWIFGGTLFFFIRFSSIFYRANQSAIDSVLEHVLATFGAGP